MQPTLVSPLPSPQPTSLKRTWTALVLPPGVMIVVFGAWGSYYAARDGLRGEQIGEAMKDVSFYAAAIVFALVFVLTTRLARKDGLSLRELGWRTPSLADVGVGLGLAAVMVALNHFLFHPALRAATPSFDPTLGILGVGQALFLQVLGVAAEDTVYRGYALTRLESRLPRLAALCVASLFYAVLSFGQGLAVVGWTFLLGLGFGGVFLWRRNLWPVAVAHYLVALTPRLLQLAGVQV
jgi:membrane protease YdiL (CAAX protease family)